MLCYAMLMMKRECYAMLCYVNDEARMLCYAMLMMKRECYAMLC